MFRVKKIKYLEKLLHILKNIYRHHVLDVFACIWARKDHPLKKYNKYNLFEPILLITIDCFKHFSIRVGYFGK